MIEVQDHEVDFSKKCMNPHMFNVRDKKYGYPVGMIVGCGKRFKCDCPQCSDSWAKRNFAKFITVLEGMQSPKMMTLTLQYDEKLNYTEEKKRLWHYRNLLFRYLRGVYKLKIKQWIGVMEFPGHIHLIWDGKYLPQKVVSRLWLQITGHSMVVDVRAVRSIRKTAGYLAGYLTKNSDSKDRRDIDDMKGLRMFQSGSVKYEKLRFTFDKDGCIAIGENGWELIYNDFIFYSEVEKWDREHR